MGTCQSNNIKHTPKQITCVSVKKSQGQFFGYDNEYYNNTNSKSNNSNHNYNHNYNYNQNNILEQLYRPEIISIFLKFATETQCQENLLFHQEVQFYKKSPSYEFGIVLFNKFIQSSSSPYLLNISPIEKAKLVKIFNTTFTTQIQLNGNEYDNILASVKLDIEQHMWPAFIQSNYFKVYNDNNNY